MSGTKKLEEEFNIAPMVKESIKTEKIPDKAKVPSQEEIKSAISAAERISKSLPDVIGLEDHETELNRLSDIGENVMMDLSKLGMGAEVQDIAPIMNVWNGIFKTVIFAKDKITERKHERIKLMMENEKLEIERDKIQLQREKEAAKKEEREYANPSVSTQNSQTKDARPAAPSGGMDRSTLLNQVLENIKNEPEADAKEVKD